MIEPRHVPQNALTSPDYWAHNKPGIQRGNVAFDPRKPIFRAHDRLLRELLPRRAGIELLEVGCHPGQFLWYFHSRFGYRVSGIDYVAAYVDETRANLQRSRVPAAIEHADLFAYAASGRTFDVVASFGFIEHFVDIAPALAAHWALVRAGGHLVVSTPNHAGLLGRLLVRLQPEVAAHHNRMDLDALHRAVAGLPGAEVLCCARIGGIGFWNSGVYAVLRERAPRAHRLLSAPLKLAEYLGPLLPDSRHLSPNLIAIARKHGAGPVDPEGTATAVG